MKYVKEISGYFGWSKKKTEKVLEEFYNAPSFVQEIEHKEKILEICLNNNINRRWAQAVHYLFDNCKDRTNELIKAILNHDTIQTPLILFNLVELFNNPLYKGLEDKPDINKIESLINIDLIFRFEISAFTQLHFIDSIWVTSELRFKLADLLVCAEISHRADEEKRRIRGGEPKYYAHEYDLLLNSELHKSYFNIVEEVGLQALYIPFFRELYLNSQDFTREGNSMISNLYLSLQKPLTSKKNFNERRDNFIFLLVMNLNQGKGLSKNKACKIVSRHLGMHNPTVRNIFWDIYKEKNITDATTVNETRSIIYKIISKYGLYGITLAALEKLEAQI